MCLRMAEPGDFASTFTPRTGSGGRGWAFFQYQGGGPAVCGVFRADTRGIPPNLDDRLVTRRPRFGMFTAVVREGYGPRLSSRRSVGEMG